jgi:hypothetical protein
MVLVPLHHTILVQEYGHVLLGFYGIKLFPIIQREAGSSGKLVPAGSW